MTRVGAYVRLDDDLLGRLDRQADRRMVSRSLLVGRAVERLLDELEDPSDWLETEARR